MGEIGAPGQLRRRGRRRSPTRPQTWWQIRPDLSILPPRFDVADDLGC